MNITKVIKAKMYPNEVFVGLGGNIGDSYRILCQTLEKIAAHPKIFDLKTSRFYCTTPVSTIPQDPYINAVCQFKTTLTLRELLSSLQDIEKKMGKKEKVKEAPRIIDLDILFFGLEACHEQDLQVPHLRWRERLFVIAPLADLIETIRFPDTFIPDLIHQVNLQEYLQNFPNIHQETVTPISKTQDKILRNLCTQYDLKSFPLAKACL